MIAACEQLFAAAPVVDAREAVVVAQFAGVRDSSRARDFGFGVRAYLVRQAGAEIKTAFLGLRLVPGGTEAFFLVRDCTAAASILAWAAQRTPGLSRVSVARFIKASRVWCELAPASGDIVTLLPDGPSRAELQARLDALALCGGELAGLKAHLARVAAREDEITVQESIALLDPVAALTARASLTEQLELIAAQLGALTSARTP